MLALGVSVQELERLAVDASKHAGRDDALDDAGEPAGVPAGVDRTRVRPYGTGSTVKVVSIRRDASDSMSIRPGCGVAEPHSIGGGATAERHLERVDRPGADAADLDLEVAELRRQEVRVVPPEVANDMVDVRGRRIDGPFGRGGDLHGLRLASHAARAHRSGCGFGVRPSADPPVAPERGLGYTRGVRPL